MSTSQRGWPSRLAVSIAVMVLLMTGSVIANASDTPAPASVVVAGSLQSEAGCPGDWDPTCLNTALVYDATDDVWQGSYAVLAGNYDYKAALNGSWDENYGSGGVFNGPNINLSLATSRIVKFYYDHETHWVTDNVNSQIPTAAGDFQSESGCPGDWDPTCLKTWLEDSDGDGIYTYSTSSIPAGNYAFKVALNEDWAVNYGLHGALNGANVNFAVPSSATKVTFRWNAATKVPSVKVQAPWTKVASGSVGGISGLAPATTGWVIVRDNKVDGQNRIARLSNSGAVTNLSWPGTQPQDLEGLAAVPRHPNQYAALTSSGNGTLLSVTGTTVTVLRTFTVPMGTNNIESFALFRRADTTVAVWATRGSTTTPATVFAATFVPSTGTFGQVATGTVTVPYPTKSVRQVSDLSVVGRRLVASSTSDPGGDGPFTSALYTIGRVSISGHRAVLTITTPQSIGRYPNHKVEGVACSGATGLLGTDDEKQGAWVRTEEFCS